MARTDAEFKEYACKRATAIARAIKAIMSGNLEYEIEIENREDEYEAQIETLVLGFNMMCEELRKMNDIANNELKKAQEYIQSQQATIDVLSTPVLEIWDQILVIPIVGTIDTKRGVDIMEGLLQAVVARRAKCAILDITGVDVVDAKAADCLLSVVRAARLLGSRCVLTGVSPAIAQILVEIDADLAEVTTLRDLKGGLEDCMSFMNRVS